jgi:protein-disulfide isomerase
MEYGDYQCPYCGQAYPIIKQVQKVLGNKLRFVFGNFPITQIHPHAQHAGEAAESAAAQNKFWEMHTEVASLLVESQVFRLYSGLMRP